MNIERQAELISRWVDGKCPICDKELKGKSIREAYLDGVTVDVCSNHVFLGMNNKIRNGFL